MAASIKDWTNDNPPQVDDDDLNGFELENNNLIQSAGMVLDTNDNNQTTKAVSVYAAAGNYFVDSGAANAYVLSPQGDKIAPPSYGEGMVIRWVATNANTGPSTVNVDSLGLKNILHADGSPLISGEIVNGLQSVAYYNGTAFILMTNTAVDNGHVNANLIIGGNFGTNPWQRQVTFSVSNSTSRFTADRFKMVIGAGSGAEVLVSQDAAVIPPAPLSFCYSSASAKILCTTADASPSGTYSSNFNYPIEGYDFQQIAQQYFVVRFVVRSSKTGIYCVSFLNAGFDRSFVAEYTINTANTWEEKIIIVRPSPTDGTWDYANGLGLCISWQVAPSSFNTGSANVWQTGQFFTTSNQVNLLDTVNATFYIDMIKVEPGTTYTGFSDSSITEKIRKCQRYYFKTYNDFVYAGDTAVDYSQSWFFRNDADTAPNQLTTIPLPNMRSIPSSCSAYSPVTGHINKVYNAGMDTDYIASTLVNQRFVIINFDGITTMPAGDYGVHIVAESEIL